MTFHRANLDDRCPPSIEYYRARRERNETWGHFTPQLLSISEALKDYRIVGVGLIRVFRNLFKTVLLLPLRYNIYIFEVHF